MNVRAATARIIAVDDEPFYLRLIEAYLSPQGYEVITSSSGTDAIELLTKPNRERVDAVLLDRSMPDMDGMEVLRHLKTCPQLGDIPVILQSGLAAPEQIAEGIAAGAYYYLAKPFTQELLSSIVGSAVSTYEKNLGM